MAWVRLDLVRRFFVGSSPRKDATSDDNPSLPASILSTALSLTPTSILCLTRSNDKGSTPHPSLTFTIANGIVMAVLKARVR